MIKHKRIIIIISVVMLFTANPAYAVLPVTDYSHIVVTTVKSAKDTVFQAWQQFKQEFRDVIDLYNAAESLYHQVEQIQQAYEQITHAITMLKGIDASNIGAFFETVNALDDQISSINSQMDGMLMRADNILDTYDSMSPTMERMIEVGMNPSQMKDIVGNAVQAQRDNIKFGRARAAIIFEQSVKLKDYIRASARSNHSASGLKDAIQMGNDIMLQQMRLSQSMHETLGLIIKQSADEANKNIMMQNAQKLEAIQTFKYDPTISNTTGPGLYHIR